MNLRALPTCVLLGVLVLGCAPVAAEPAEARPAESNPSEALRSDRVVDAMLRMRQYLLQRQTQRGDWEPGSGDGAASAQAYDHHGHTTALVTLALLESGVSSYHPAVQAAMRSVEHLPAPDSYTLYPRLLCWARMPDAFKDQLGRDAAAMLTMSRDGAYFHDDEPTPQADLLATYFGVMSVHAAAGRGYPVPPGYWRDVGTRLIHAQQTRGGWRSGSKAPDAMSPVDTAAGLAMLHACRQHLLAYPQAVQQVNQAIARGQHALSQAFDLRDFTANPVRPRPAMPAVAGRAVGVDGAAGVRVGSGVTHSFESPLHGLVLLDSLARTSGSQTLGGRVWLPDAIDAVLALEAGRGHVRGDLLQTTLALRVLASSRCAVWANLLTVPGQPAQGVEDALLSMQQISAALSSAREHELIHHRVSIDEPLAAWLAAPLTVLSSESAVALTDEQRDRLTRYLGLGGMLIVIPQNGAQRLPRAMQPMGPALVPGGDWRQRDAAERVFDGGLPSTMRGRVLVRGQRPLIYLAQQDMLAPARDGAYLTPAAFDAWYSLYRLSSSHGRLSPRVDPRLIPPVDDAPLRVHARVWRVQQPASPVSLEVEHDAEPMLWPVMQHRLRQQGIGVTAEVCDLAALADASPALAHFSGIAEVRLDVDALEAMCRFAERGGTVLVETVGGKGPFARSVQGQVESHLGREATAVAAGHALMRRAPASGYPLTGYARVRGMAGDHCRVQRIALGRGEVLFSHVDITMGALGSRWWPVMGYTPDAARSLLSALLLQTGDAQRQGVP